MSTIIKDISTITTIPESALCDLLGTAVDCISYEASNLSTQEIVTIDIGIGELRVKKIGGDLMYKFIPSTKLDNSIRNAISGNVNLIRRCEDTLVGKILNTYKDLL